MEIVKTENTGYITYQQGNVQVRIPVLIRTIYTKYEDGRQDCEVIVPRLSADSKLSERK